MITSNASSFNDYLLVAGWYDPTVSLSIRIKGPAAGDTLSVGLGGAHDRNTVDGKIFKNSKKSLRDIAQEIRLQVTPRRAGVSRSGDRSTRRPTTSTSGAGTSGAESARRVYGRASSTSKERMPSIPETRGSPVVSPTPTSSWCKS